MPVMSTAKLIIPSQVRLVDLVHAAAEKMAALAGFGEDEALNLGIAVREAVINAIRHGNAEDPAKQVQIDLEAHDDGFRAAVRDRGSGFDPDGEADPTAPENLLRTSGRGLLMVRAFVDDVEFRAHRDDGFTVTMFKRRNDHVGGDGTHAS